MVPHPVVESMGVEAQGWRLHVRYAAPSLALRPLPSQLCPRLWITCRSNPHLLEPRRGVACSLLSGSLKAVIARWVSREKAMDRGGGAAMWLRGSTPSKAGMLRSQCRL